MHDGAILSYTTHGTSTELKSCPDTWPRLHCFTLALRQQQQGQLSGRIYGMYPTPLSCLIGRLQLPDPRGFRHCKDIHRSCISSVNAVASAYKYKKCTKTKSKNQHFVVIWEWKRSHLGVMSCPRVTPKKNASMKYRMSENFYFTRWW